MMQELTTEVTITDYSDISVDSVLDFLNEHRTTNQIREKFRMSNSQWYHYKAWLLKAKFIVCIKCSGVQQGKTNNTFLYIRSDL